jgi:transposase
MEEETLRKTAIKQYLQGKAPRLICCEMRRSKRWFFKWLNRYRSGDAEWYQDRSRRPHTNICQTSPDMRQLVSNIRIQLQENPFARVGTSAIKYEFLRLGVTPPSDSTINRILRRAGLVRKNSSLLEQYGLIQKNLLSSRVHHISSEKAPLIIKRQYINSRYSLKSRSTIHLTLTETDRKTLGSFFRSTMTPAGLAKRSHIILSLAEGRTPSETALLTNVSRQIVYKWAHRFIERGIDGLNRFRRHIITKADNDTIKSAIFSILHSPPSEHGINRTSWKIDDLKKCLLLSKDISISKAVIRRVIRSAGFKWRRARTVLTSPDPEYKQKLTEIQSILAKLSPEERFFSIDEFGPFAIKRRGGRKLVSPEENHYVEQRQISKGSLIITGALELSHNKITHFYSPKKNTKEMIKLLELLLVEYKSCKRIFLSWDAAAWHVSKALYQRVDEINSNEYQQGQEIPKVVLAPLPKSAQFLNVIESVFSGMARAIIHNSDYESKEAAMKAVDRYFEERNIFFEKNPCKAGKKIWGDEIVSAEFSEGQNCKDPKWCRC